MVRYILLAAVMAFSVAGGPDARASESKGAASITLDGGSRGAVVFPHRLHQDKLNDCGACHEVFPQEAGVIRRFKAEGRLGGKQVMNKLCISCHRSVRNAGGEAGPVSCSECHSKAKE